MDKYLNNTLQEVVNEISKQKEEILNESLNGLIKTGLLVIETGPFTLFQDFNTNKYIFQQSCRLILKDKEYIQTLEKENNELKERLKSIQEAIREIDG